MDVSVTCVLAMYWDNSHSFYLCRKKPRK